MRVRALTSFVMFDPDTRQVVPVAYNKVFEIAEDIAIQLMAEGLVEEYKGELVFVDTEMSDISTNPVENKVVKKYIDDQQYIELSCHVDNQIIQAGKRKMFEIPVNNIPEGYEIKAWRNASINLATDGGVGSGECIIQFFSTTGKGTKAQLPVINLNKEADAKIRVGVTVLCGKIK